MLVPDVTENTFSLSQRERHLIAEVAREIANDKAVDSLRKMNMLRQIIPQEIQDCMFQSFFRNATRDKFVLIKNLPPINHNLILMGFSSIIGDLIHYLGEGDLIMDIKVDQNCIDQVPSYRNSKGMALHTDLSYFDNPPDAISMICIHTGTQSVRSFYCNINDALALLAHQEIEELQKEQFIFQAPEHTIKKSEIGRNSPRSILTIDENQYRIRFRHDLCQALSTNGQRACDSLADAMEKTAKEFRYENSSLVLLDNRFLTHGRSGFTPDFSNERPRHLKRAYIRQKQR
jgi:alpha-ketoglutarate-dependent taurine dioxygenase